MVVALAVIAAACGPMAPPTDGVDLRVTVSDNVGATIGSNVTYQATVSSVGTAATTGPVAATVVVPPGQTVTGAVGSGWACTNDAAQATCRVEDADVQPGQALPTIRVTADVAGPTFVGQVYAAISSEGDVNPANDEAVGKVIVTPPIEGDQLFIQLAGALSLRNGGTISSGDVSITPDPAGGLGGADRLLIDASVGSTQVLADLQRTTLTLFTGTITVTDPTLQGGVPLTVNWRGPVFSFGLAPWRSLGSELLGLRVPSLDVSGVTGALANGLTFTLNFTAADYAPVPPGPQPPLSYFDNNPSDLAPSVSPPSRVVTGAEFTLPIEIDTRGGSTVGPVAATVDLPADLEYVRAGSGSTCTPVPAVPGRVRCTLDDSITQALRPNLLAGLAGTVLPVPTRSIDLRVRATTQDVPLTVSAVLGSANSVNRTASATFSARPPGPDVGLAMNGPELTPSLFFQEGTGLAGNQYSFAVDNVGTATSASPFVTVTLPEGVTFRGVTNPATQPTPASRFTCGATGQVVTCTRPNGIGVTSLISPAPSFAVQVDVATPTSPTVTATAAVTNSNDVNPDGPDKSATATTRVAAAGAPTYDIALSNGAFSTTARPVLEGGYTFTTTPSGRIDGISGCGTSMNYVPPVLVVPVVGPTLVPAIFADNTLCVDITRVAGTNDFAGTVRTDFVTAPVFLPPPVPQELPLPPIIDPRQVSVSANQNVTLTGLLDGRATGSADGSSVELVLNGGAEFTTTWALTAPPSATCTDINACP